MEMFEIYKSPVCKVIQYDFEGIVCRSVGNESVGEEEGNGGFTYFDLQ